MFSFLALEILTHKLASHFREDLTSRLRMVDGEDNVLADTLPLAQLVWDKRRMPLKPRFAIVALELFPETAQDDLERFGRFVDARHELSHGAIESGDQLPVTDCEGLLAKYVEGAVKRLMLGVPASTTWDDLAAGDGSNGHLGTRPSDP